MIKSEIICDSTFNGNRIVTYCLEYPRFIHSELMTHRVFSRNAMSSRAVPIEKMIEQVENNPAMPVQWGLNQSGMQAGKLHDNPNECEKEWKHRAQRAAVSARWLQKLGLHKQIVNRVLEPFQLMKTVVTSTEWDNFFELRTHKDAQPEFQVLAKLMKEQFDNNTPEELLEGEWHLPYVKFDRPYEVTSGDWSTQLFYCDQNTRDNYLQLEDAIKISASCCAQVSYRVNDDSIEKALMIYDKLVNSTPIHASPFEHQAKCVGTLISYESIDNICSIKAIGDGIQRGITHFDTDGNYWSGNFKNWIQYRQLL